MFSCRVVGWVMADNLATALTIKALEMVLNRLIAGLAHASRV